MASFNPWSDWEWAPGLCAALLLAAVWYIRLNPGGLARTGERAAAGPAGPGSRWAFLAGLALLAVAWLSPLDVMGRRALFSAHMLHNVLVTHAAAPLLVAGLRRRLAPRPEWSARLRPWLHPVRALLLFTVTVYAWHLPPLYDRMLRDPLLHPLKNGLLLATGLCLWAPILGPLWTFGWPRLSTGRKLLYLAAAEFPMALLGLAFTVLPRPLYAAYPPGLRLFGLSPLADQMAGGIVMFFAGTLFLVLAILLEADPASAPALPEPVQERHNEGWERAPEEGRP